MRNPSSLTAAVVLPPLVGGGLAMLAIYGTGIYGLALFLAVPFLLGWMATAVLRVAIGPQRLRRCFEVSALSAIFLGVLFLVFKAEGAFCLILALPVAVPCLLFGAWAAWRAFHRRDRNRAALPARRTSDRRLRLHPHPRAAASRLDLSGRRGVSQRTRIVAPRTNGLRVCTMSTGVVFEVWKPEHFLRWRTQTGPPPMKDSICSMRTSILRPSQLRRIAARRSRSCPAPRSSRAVAGSARGSRPPVLKLWCELALEHVRDLAQSKGATS